MPRFFDPCIRDTSDELRELAQDIGWEDPDSYSTVFLEAENWGELKQKIKDNRDDCDILVFLGGDEDLNRKAASDSRIDILLHPEKGRKDSGINHVIAKEAAENRVAIGFDLNQLKTGSKTRTHILDHWRQNVKLCNKFDTPYVITTSAREKFDLRPPRELESLMNSLGLEGRKAVSLHPEKIIERAEERKSDGFEGPGLEVEEE